MYEDRKLILAGIDTTISFSYLGDIQRASSSYSAAAVPHMF